MSIDRRELVRLHNPKLDSFVWDSPLSVGNGEFVFTADPTGLQSFPEGYEQGLPLCTMSHWGWHSYPFSSERFSVTRDDLVLTPFDTYGRTVGYAKDPAPGNEDVYNWLRQNPHRLNLARIGFAFTGKDGRRARRGDIGGISQTLDLYAGILYSEFTVFGEPCRVETCCHPERDQMSVRIKSPMADEGRIAIEIRFPYGSHRKNGSDWENGAAHISTMEGGCGSARISRTLDRDQYEMAASFPGARMEQTDMHTFVISGNLSEASFLFSREKAAPSDAGDAFAKSAAHWERYWQDGGILRLNRSQDPRAFELERRIILSQYVTALQCGGSVPPAETGLTCNSWYGKFHLEMHFWHSAHFHFWGRTAYLEKSMQWYLKHLDDARALARSQGYKGARWPKMVAENAVDSPSTIAPLLIWQQPHIICMLEWCYQAHPDRETLEKYRDVMFESAEFMADYAHYDAENDRYVLGPPCIPAQERHDPATCINPTYELEYWRTGLRYAQAWKRRLGLPEDPLWQDIIDRMAVPPVHDGVYVAQERCPDTFTVAATDHPSMLCAYGLLDSERIDRETMARTLDRVLREWDYPSMWGWDFGVIAMTATRLGLPQTAVDALLIKTEKNDYTENGHNRQLSRDDLPLYLPGNGSLLLAAAMMAAGYPGCGTEHPGFPEGWTVEAEGLRPYIALE